MSGPIPTDTTPRILLGDCVRVLRTLPEESVHCIVTSYPYWGLRDYGTCSCVRQGRLEVAEDARGDRHTEGGAIAFHRVEGEADPACPHCNGTGRVQMETVWDEPSEPCDHDWATTFSYWDNRRAAALAATGEDPMGSKEDRRGKVPSTQCRKCGAWRGAFGLEPSVGMYVAHAVQVGDELRRVLRSDGTLWLNLGDCYSGSGRGPEGNLSASRQEKGGSAAGLARERPLGLKPKDLVGVPWRVAFALQLAGWYLRCDVVWAKPNPMPESVRDRPSRSHEYVFLLTKSERYFHDADAVRVALNESTVSRAIGHGGPNGGSAAAGKLRPLGDWDGEAPEAARDRAIGRGLKLYDGLRNDGSPTEIEERILAGVSGGTILGSNLKSVWPIPTQPFPEAHFATFPEALVETCVRAGTSDAGACSVCGTPWVREVRAVGGTIGHDWHPDKSLEKGRVQGIPDEAGDGSYRRLDLGFRPRCAHPDAPKVPCVVLDPFGGSGTTPAVARRLGRRSVAVELNPLYVALAERRVGKYRDLESWGEIG